MKNLDFNKNISRRSMLGFAAALGMGVLTGCSDSDSSDKSDKKPAKAKAQSKPKSKYAVTIDNCTKVQDYEGNPAVIIDLTFTNNSKKTTSLAAECQIQVFQNGTEMETAITDQDLGNGYMGDVKPGASMQAKVAYSVKDNSEISVEVSEAVSFDDEKIAEKKFSLS